MTPSMHHSEHVELVAATPSTTTNAPELIAGSWRRCLSKHKLNPDATPVLQVLESHHIKEHTQRHDYLLGVAQQELIDLYNQMLGSGYSVFMTDAKGTVLHQVCDPSYIGNMRSVGLRVGADWSEATFGTNGVGTCIIEQRPLTVHLEDHFHTSHTPFSCSAAPIRDPAGELLAVLDCSAIRHANPLADKQTLGLVRNTASFIEGLYFLRLHRNDIIIHLSASPDAVPQPRNAMIAITLDGRITGANERALQVLGATSRQRLCGSQINHVFDLRKFSISASNAGQIHQLRMINRGTYTFATWQIPMPQSSGFYSHEAERDSPPSAAALLPVAAAELGHSELQLNIETAADLLNQNMAVLLQGETGTGKDVLARQLHDKSRFSDGPFVAVDCCESALDLLLDQCKDLANSCDETSCPVGGTLFLNDANLMSSTAQSRLLELMHRYERPELGSAMGFNVIAACRGELHAQVNQQLFREDLYYRLAQFVVDIPALRHRASLVQLIEHMLRTENARQHKQITLSDDATSRLLDYPWPGNIRELQSALRTAVTVCRGTLIEETLLPASLFKPTVQNSNAPCQSALNSSKWTGLEAAELEVLLRELRNSRWNISATAKKINMSRNTIYRKMEKYGISPDSDGEA